MISRVVGLRYEVLERVGEGALFQAFKARDKLMNRMVAVKTLQPELSADADLAGAMRGLGEELASLLHPNIARLYEVGEDEGAPFLVTEFVRGINLKERIRRIAPFTPWVAVDFAISIAEAVQYAHGEGIIHGDLRPQNVIVSPEGAVKVTDFGSGRLLAASPKAAALTVGRAAPYRSPEVTAGQPVAASSDIYAIGAIIFEMLTGGVPYPGETPLIIASRHQNDPVPSPRSLNPGVPRALEGIVLRCLQKRPDDRYRAAADLVNDLKQVRDGLRFGKSLAWSPMEPASAPAAPAPPPTQERTSRVSAPVAAAPAPAAVAEPAEETAATGASRMMIAPPDDRVPGFLMFLLKSVVAIFVLIIVVGVAYFMAMMSKPQEQTMPNLVGMQIDKAQEVAGRVNARLMRHDDYNDKFPVGAIWRVDPDLTGRPVRVGRSINVWVSKGSRMVWVPNLRNVAKDEADAKLKAAGLALGAVNREYNDKVPYDYVIAQNPRADKRVGRDTSVNLIISDGPNLEDTGSTSSAGNTDSNPAATDQGPATTPPTDTSSGGQPDTSSLQTRTFPLEVSVKRDGLGMRQVRVEYDDATGTHIPFDEMHNEGDVLRQSVDVTGAKMTVRVYYNGDLRNEQTFYPGQRRHR